MLMETIAESIVYNSLDLLSAEVNDEPLIAFNAAVENIVPKMEVKSRRVDSTYQVPNEVKHTRGISLAMDWLINTLGGEINTTKVVSAVD